MSKIDTQPITNFIGLVKSAKQSNQRTVNISIADAEKLSNSLSQTMTRLVSVQEDVIEAYKSVQQNQTISVEMDGGSWTKK